jgi:hypothetical protein
MCDGVPEGAMLSTPRITQQMGGRLVRAGSRPRQHTGSRTPQPERSDSQHELPRTVIHDHLEIDLLPYFQIHHSSALDSADVDADVEPTVTWLEETVPLPGVEPFYGSSLHRHLTVTADNDGQGEGITFSAFQS